MKIATCAGVTAALGVAAHSPETDGWAPGTVDLHLDAWRVRPGAVVPLTIQTSERGASEPSKMLIHLVEVGSKGQVTAWLGRVEAQSTQRGQWSADIKAPSQKLGADRESYLLAAALRQKGGKLVVSDPVEVICTPLCAGA